MANEDFFEDVILVSPPDANIAPDPNRAPNRAENIAPNIATTTGSNATASSELYTGVVKRFSTRNGWGCITNVSCTNGAPVQGAMSAFNRDVRFYTMDQVMYSLEVSDVVHFNAEEDLGAPGWFRAVNISKTGEQRELEPTKPKPVSSKPAEPPKRAAKPNVHAGGEAGGRSSSAGGQPQRTAMRRPVTPPVVRPTTTPVVARRLISTHLEVRLSADQRAEERAFWGRGRQAKQGDAPAGNEGGMQPSAQASASEAPGSGRADQGIARTCPNSGIDETSVEARALSGARADWEGRASDRPETIDPAGHGRVSHTGPRPRDGELDQPTGFRAREVPDTNDEGASLAPYSGSSGFAADSAGRGSAGPENVPTTRLISSALKRAVIRGSGSEVNAQESSVPLHQPAVERAPEVPSGVSYYGEDRPGGPWADWLANQANTQAGTSGDSAAHGYPPNPPDETRLKDPHEERSQGANGRVGVQRAAPNSRLFSSALRGAVDRTGKADLTVQEIFEEVPVAAAPMGEQASSIDRKAPPDHAGGAGRMRPAEWLSAGAAAPGSPDGANQGHSSATTAERWEGQRVQTINTVADRRAGQSARPPSRLFGSALKSAVDRG